MGEEPCGRKPILNDGVEDVTGVYVVELPTGKSTLPLRPPLPRFCCTSSFFGGSYTPLLRTGKEIFDLLGFD